VPLALPEEDTAAVNLNARMLSLGDAHTLLLDFDGRLFGVGRNRERQVSKLSDHLERDFNDTITRFYLTKENANQYNLLNCRILVLYELCVFCVLCVTLPMSGSGARCPREEYSEIILVGFHLNVI
jgi:hypothetical protein